MFCRAMREEDGSPGPVPAAATRISTRVCGATKPAMSETSSTGTDIARIPAGIISGITPEVVWPMKSLLATIGSLATNSLLANEPATVCGSVNTPCGRLSRDHRTSLTGAGASLVPTGMSLDATTTSMARARARCTSDSRLLSAENPTIAATIAPMPARITNTIGRFISAPRLRDLPPAAGPHAQIQSLALVVATSAFWRRGGTRAPPPCPRGLLVDAGLGLSHGAERLEVTSRWRKPAVLGSLQGCGHIRN